MRAVQEEEGANGGGGLQLQMGLAEKEWLPLLFLLQIQNLLFFYLPSVSRKQKGGRDGQGLERFQTTFSKHDLFSQNNF
jgi:hypothetical protein